MSRIIRYFPESDLRGGHDGLARVANKNGLNLKSLGVGEYVIFVNRKKNALKMFAGNSQLIAYLRLDKGRLDLRTIRSIPNYFNGTEIDYQGALKKVLERDFRSDQI